MFNSVSNALARSYCLSFAIDCHELAAVRPLGEFLGFGLNERDGSLALAVGPKRDVLGLDQLDRFRQLFEP